MHELHHQQSTQNQGDSVAALLTPVLLLSLVNFSLLNYTELLISTLHLFKKSLQKLQVPRPSSFLFLPLELIILSYPTTTKYSLKLLTSGAPGHVHQSFRKLCLVLSFLLSPVSLPGFFTIPSVVNESALSTFTSGASSNHTAYLSNLYLVS